MYRSSVFLYKTFYIGCRSFLCLLAWVEGHASLTWKRLSIFSVKISKIWYSQLLTTMTYIRIRTIPWGTQTNSSYCRSNSSVCKNLVKCTGMLFSSRGIITGLRKVCNNWTQKRSCITINLLFVYTFCLMQNKRMHSSKSVTTGPRKKKYLLWCAQSCERGHWNRRSRRWTAARARLVYVHQWKWRTSELCPILGFSFSPWALHQLFVPEVM